MIKFRTVSVDVDMKSTSAFSAKRFTPDMPEVRIQVQSKIEEYDEMGYDLWQMTPVNASVMQNTFTYSILMVFKMRDDN